MAWTRMSASLVLLLAAGCGYARSGTWEDDAKNFRRAWGMDPPQGVEVARSWYRRMPHFTREEAYFFELRGGAELAESFVEANEMSPAGPEALAGADFCFGPPEWFAPGPAERYEVWTGERARALLARDRRGGQVFIHACQL